MNFNIPAALAYYPKMTYSRWQKLRAYFLNLNNVWQTEIENLITAGWEENVSAEFIDWREKFNLQKMEEELTKEKIYTLSLGEKGYPRLLAEIADPPLILFVRGKMPDEERPAIAVVGTRRFTNYGQQVTEELAADLAKQGVVIVSGLALGIDGVAHTAALRVGGATVAVLGSGVNKKNIYPVSHAHLAEQIIEQNGAIISEYPPGFEPTQYSFPARNRIIAGLTLGALVTEAPMESGALITAKCALDYNRDVFAVPHQITAVNGAGCNNLIKLGAKTVTQAADILEELQIQNIEQIVANNKVIPASPCEQKLLLHLTREPLHIDALTKLTNLDSATINATITIMEMKGRVKNLGGMMYVLK